MTPQQLRSEIDTDPEELGYAALVTAGSDAGVAALLNAPGADSVNRRLVPRGELLEALAGVGGLAAIYGGAADPQSPAFGLCKTAALILDDPDGSLDYTRAGTRALVAALGPGVAGILSADELAALQSVCVRAGSRAEVLWGEGVVVSAGDVAAAFGRI